MCPLCAPPKGGGAQAKFYEKIRKNAGFARLGGGLLLYLTAHGRNHPKTWDGVYGVCLY